MIWTILMVILILWCYTCVQVLPASTIETDPRETSSVSAFSFIESGDRLIQMTLSSDNLELLFLDPSCHPGGRE